MRVAILSDIHDRIPKLRAALASLDGIDVLLCLGDLCSPFIVRELGDGFHGPTHIVFGNNDGDRFRIANVAVGYPQLILHGEFADLEIGGRRFAVNHFDDIGNALAEGGHFDVVCFGHDHRYRVERVADGSTLIVNPGEIFGGLTGKSTFVVYDTESGEVERREV